jgi:hypothetical protein
MGLLGYRYVAQKEVVATSYSIIEYMYGRLMRGEEERVLVWYGLCICWLELDIFRMLDW